MLFDYRANISSSYGIQVRSVRAHIQEQKQSATTYEEAQPRSKREQRWLLVLGHCVFEYHDELLYQAKSGSCLISLLHLCFCICNVNLDGPRKEDAVIHWLSLFSKYWTVCSRSYSTASTHTYRKERNHSQQFIYWYINLYIQCSLAIWIMRTSRGTSSEIDDPIQIIEEIPKVRKTTSDSIEDCDKEEITEEIL